MAAEEEKDSATKVYARIRGIMPWEETFLGVNWTDSTISVKKKSYTFSSVLGPASTNEEAFDTVCSKLLNRVLDGFNAVVIAYGQTGSGKTYSMLGKPKLNVVGLIPRCLECLAESPEVSNVYLSAVEAFGHHPSKINLYDLFANQGIGWGEKHGHSMLDPKKCTKRMVVADSAMDLVNEAHKASHFAPTGKNPESSRGHVAFIVSVVRRDKGTTQTSYMILVDLAGSEGETSLDGDFAKRASPATLTARRLEAGCINTGLSQLQVIFGELGNKGSLSAVVGNGLRRILHPFINTSTYLSVIFAISPSAQNNMSTHATLKFASRACKIKTKPVKAKKKQTLKQLKVVLQEREEQIEELHADLQDLERDLDVTAENFHNVKNQINTIYYKLNQSEKKKFSKDGLLGLLRKLSQEFLEEDFTPKIEDDEDGESTSVLFQREELHDRRPSEYYVEQTRSSVAMALELVGNLEKETDDNALEAPESMRVSKTTAESEINEVKTKLQEREGIERDEEALQSVIDEQLNTRLQRLSIRAPSILDIDPNELEAPKSFEALQAKIRELEMNLHFEKDMNKQLRSSHRTQIEFYVHKRPKTESKNQITYFHHV